MQFEENLHKVREELASNDIAALTTLFNEVYDDLYDFGKNISGDSELTKNIIHDLFIYIWEKRKKLSQIQYLKAYIFKVLKNRIIKEISLDKGRVSLSDPHIIDIDFSKYNFTAEDSFSKETKKAIINMLNSLTASEKHVVYLKYYQGMSYDEIASVMDIKNQSARNLMTRTLKRMKQIAKESNVSVASLLLFVSSMS